MAEDILEKVMAEEATEIADQELTEQAFAAFTEDEIERALAVHVKELAESVLQEE